jgi:uncharacterized protein with PQ loop repeat
MVYAFLYIINIIFINLGINEKGITYINYIQYNLDIDITNNYNKKFNIVETIGYIGGVLLAICSVPEVFRTIKDSTCHLGWTFLLLWFFGELFMIVYAFHLWDYPLLFNYGFNLLLVGIMLFYKVKKA